MGHSGSRRPQLKKLLTVSRMLPIFHGYSGLASSARATGDEARPLEIVSADHRILSSHLLGDDGEWRVFMTAHYRRRK
jgi:hypothetical protein